MVIAAQDGARSRGSGLESSRADLSKGLDFPS
jgi:hypothetical protein